MEQAIINFVLEFAAKYPQLAVLFIVVGVLRMVFKPLFSFLRMVADATPTVSDNLLLDKVQASKVYTAIAWFIDYISSVKLPYYDIKK